MNFKCLSYLGVFCALWATVSAQTLTDNFTDGDFSNNPVWLGNTAAFRVNPQLQLQLNENVASNSTRYLSVPAATSTNDSTTWEFWAHELFSPSSTNYVAGTLTATTNDPVRPSLAVALGCEGSSSALETPTVTLEFGSVRRARVERLSVAIATRAAVDASGCGGAGAAADSTRVRRPRPGTTGSWSP